MLSPLYVNMMVNILHPGSLSEGAAERSEAEGVYFDEWERSNIQSFVGAMKIARNVAVSGRRGEWYSRSPLPL